MSRSTHPMERLVAPLTLVKAETWVECAGRCSVHWRVTLQNQAGDERTQAGAIAMQPPRDNSGWFAFWQQVAAWMMRFRLELHWLPIVNALPWKTLVVIDELPARMQTQDIRELVGDHWEDMQNMSEVDLAVVQYLCKLRIENVP